MALQLNSKELKTFRDTLAKWHIADFKLADELLQKQARVRNYQNLIESNNEMLEKIANGESVLRTKEDLDAENEKFAGLVEDENAAYTTLREEVTKDLDAGRALVSEDLTKLMTGYCKDIYSADAENALISGLVKWFSDNGAKNVADDDVKPYIRALGQRKASAKQKCKNNAHNGVNVKKTMVDIFLGSLCDEPNMAKALPTHKWETIIEKKVANK